MLKNTLTATLSQDQHHHRCLPENGERAQRSFWRDALRFLSTLWWCIALTLTPMMISTPAQSKALFDDFLDTTGLDRLFQSGSSGEFQTFLEEFWPEASRYGITLHTYRSAFSGLTPDESLLHLSQNQAEFKKSLSTYLSERLTPKRIARGVEMAQKYHQDLVAMERTFGVSRFILLAIWGLETHYGTVKGDKDILRSLATLSFSGKRQAFARKQLLAALMIFQNGEVLRKNFKGSWAGAMGHTQFMPVTYATYAVDWTGDGKRDIWTSELDALASTAHYLQQSGWKPQTFCTAEAILTTSVAQESLFNGPVMPVSRWNALGIAFLLTPSHVVHANTPVKVLAPEGAQGPLFFVGENFKALLAYNKSNAYALSVGLLAYAIAVGAGEAF